MLHEQHEPALRTADDLGTKEVVSADEELTAMGWPVEPAGLTRLLVWLRDTYPTLPPIYITENGRACDDVVTPDEQVDDPDRVRYLDSHLRAVADAIDAGVDVRGYYCWSLKLLQLRPSHRGNPSQKAPTCIGFRRPAWLTASCDAS